MKVIGLIGGMSWESTLEYYRIINETVKERLGGLHSAKILLYSVNFHEVESMQSEGRWEEAREILCNAATRIERGGGECLLICTNTMHIMASEVQCEVGIPLIHIADATAAEIKNRGVRKIGLLGTKYTMEEHFYKGRLIQDYGLEVMVPAKADRDVVHQVIYNELCLGKILADSRKQFVRIMDDMLARGADGVVLGCTEISLLVSQRDSHIPLFDTTEIHARAAVDFAMGE